MKLKRIAIAVAAILFASSAQAQVPPPVLQQAPVFGSFYLGARSPDVSATTTSGTSAVALGTAAGVAYVCNTGSNNAYFRLGASTITVTAANGIPLIAGQCGNFYATGATHIVGITATSTATLQIAMGWGSAFAAGGGSGGGGGGSVTQGTTPWVVDTVASGGNLIDAINSPVPCLPAATASTNTYSAGTPSPVNCNLNGNIWTQPSSSPPDTRPVAGNITIQDTGSTTSSGQNSVTIYAGTPTANSFQTQAINGASTSRIQLTGTWTGTIMLQGSMDSATTWINVPCRVTGTVFTTSSVTANGMFDCDTSGLTNIRAVATAAVTGTVTVRFVISSVGGPVQVLNPIRLVDNTSGASAAVKAASTAPASTDTATVVTVRPETYSDPCEINVPTFTPIAISTAANTRIAVGVAAKRVYVCAISFKISAGGSDNIGIVEGSGGTCAGSPVGIWGGATAAAGFIGAAGDGLAVGSGKSAVWKTSVDANDLCFITSAAVVVSGHIKYVTQ